MTFLRTRPICAVCGRPVDSLEEREIFGRVRFIARCHGDVESVDLTVHEARGLLFGKAFAGPRLLGPMR